MQPIVVEHLSKYYDVHQKEPGLAGSIRSFFNRKYFQVKAVDDVTFSISSGEMVGFLGPNGAGKTTTLKVLAGLLYPTKGRVQVLGFNPHERRSEFLKQLTLVMGQKNQLMWDLPAIETFLVNKAIYGIPGPVYQSVLNELDQLLDLGPLLKKQVRKLSLGERMKCELAAALLHQPKVLFLDEPTIGLDVTMQVAIRDFIIEYNRRHGATLILTSHYMADVTAITRRIIVIDRGRLLYDGDLPQLVEQVAPYKLLSITLEHPDRAVLSQYGEIQAMDGAKVILRVPRHAASDVAAQVLTNVKPTDVLIEEPPVEDIIRQVFAESKAAREAEEKRQVQEAESV